MGGVSRTEPAKHHARKGDNALISLSPQRDATLVSVLAYAGLRPFEALRLTWGHVQERTLVVTASKTGQRRSVRLLAPLAADLAAWKLASADTRPDALLFPAMTETSGPRRRTSRGGGERLHAPLLRPAALTRLRPQRGTASPRFCCTRAGVSSTSRASSGTARTSRC